MAVMRTLFTDLSFNELLAVLDVQSACGGNDATAAEVVDGCIVDAVCLDGCDGCRDVEVLRAACDDDLTVGFDGLATEILDGQRSTF